MSTHVRVPVAASITGIGAREIRRLCREGAIRWGIDARRMKTVAIADLASLLRRADAA